MEIQIELPKLKLYFTLDEEFCALLEQEGISYASARQLSKLAVGLLRGLKKSVASTQRVYFPEFTYKDVLKHLKDLEKKFSQINGRLIERFCNSLDFRKRIFIICDDYLIPRYTKKAFRAGLFRDPVKKKLV